MVKPMGRNYKSIPKRQTIRKNQREGYDRYQAQGAALREPGKEADAVFMVLGGIVLFIIIVALVSLGLKLSQK